MRREGRNMASSAGFETSKSRVNLTPTTKTPPSSKVIASSAHGASMEPRSGNKPSGWAGNLGGGDTAKGMCSEEYAKSGKEQKKPALEFSPKGPKPSAY